MSTTKAGHTEVEEGTTYVCRTDLKTLMIRADKEFIHRGDFVKILSFNDISGSAYVRTRLGETSKVRLNELKPKPTVFYDGIPTAQSHTPIEGDNMPVVGECIEGYTILRVKPVQVSTISGYCTACETLDESLRFLLHSKRPFVYWCVELDLFV